MTRYAEILRIGFLYIRKFFEEKIAKKNLQDLKNFRGKTAQYLVL